MTTLAKGVATWFVGRWKEAFDLCEQADECFRTRCTGVSWEMDTARAFRLYALLQMGEVSELLRVVPQLLGEAESRGDLYVLAHLGAVNGPFIELVDDDVDGAERRLRNVAALLPNEKFETLKNDLLISSITIHLYNKNIDSASSELMRYSEFMHNSLMHRLQIFRIVFWELRCRVLLALAASSKSNVEPSLRAAERDARRLEREKTPLSVASARAVLAGVAQVRGDTPRALEQYSAAVSAFEALDMRLIAAAARRRLGEILGGDEGTALVAEADTWMMRQGIKNPTRMTALFSPVGRKLGRD